MTESTEDLLRDALVRLLDDASDADTVRRIEGGESADALWARIVESGFADALLPESAGGAGLGLADAFELFLCCGRYALPVPLAQTMLVRAWCAAAELPLPEGPIAIAAPPASNHGGSLRCSAVPFGAVASSVLVPREGVAWLMDASDAEREHTGVHASLQAGLRWQPTAEPIAVLESPGAWIEGAAAVTSALMAGSMEGVLQRTLRHASEREQFGRPIGKFQAIQQQISAMAEQVFAARIAAELACHGDRGHAVRPVAAAIGKARASEAAVSVAAIAHAVHGAIGVTDEYDLHLFTRRLLEWRLDYGSESLWHGRLGDALLASPASSVLDYMLTELPAALR